MTTNKKDNATTKKSRVKISKLQVNKETVKDLTDKEAEQIKGGAGTTSGGCGGAGIQPNPVGAPTNSGICRTR
jgi:hypothetical protein